MPLNPFHNLPNRRQVWAWGMYDLANQSFTLLITTLFFGIYFQQTVVSDPARGEALWGRAFGIASLIVVLLSPLLGAVADFSGRKRAFLLALGAGCIALTASLALCGPGDVALAMTLYIGANVLFMSGENFLGAFLPEISTRETIGRVSAIGWTMGYIGAMTCLPLALVLVVLTGADKSGDFRPVFLFAAGWFLVNALPTVLILRERAAPQMRPDGTRHSLATIGFVRIGETVRHAGRHADLARFLGVFFVYSCGVQVIVVYSGIIARNVLSDTTTLILFTWALAAIAGAGGFATALVQDRIGHRLTISIGLVIWLATALGAAALPASNAAPWHIWAVGFGVGAGLAIIGASSRAFVGAMTPAHKTAEFFGLWGMAFKAAGFAGPVIYSFFAGAGQQRIGMFVVAGSFAAGLVLMRLVNAPRGVAAAREADHKHAAKVCEPAAPALTAG